MKKEKLYLENLFDFDWNDKVKIKFNQTESKKNKNPLELWCANPETVNTEWLFWEKDKNHFRVGDIALCLIDMGKDRWLLTSVKKINKVLPDFGDVHYEGTELPEYHPFYGRLVLLFHKTGRQVIRRAYPLTKQIEVLELLPDIYTGNQFPGYDKVHLSWFQLEHIFKCKKPDWMNALSKQKGIYLITDNHKGKLYVGSASGENEGLWQRWEQYVKNGHGGNQELKALKFDYIKRFFTYTILENYNFNVSREIIIEREQWWKTVLDSVKHGYNKK